MKPLSTLLEWVGFLLALYGLIVVAAILKSCAEPSPAEPDFAADWSNGEVLKITTARGERVQWKVIGSKSVAGHWASPTGLVLTLKNPETGWVTTVEVAPASEPTWDESIQISKYSGAAVVIEGELTLEEVAGAETQTISGEVVGRIVYPEWINAATFVNRSEDVMIPVEVRLVSSERSALLKQESTDARKKELASGRMFIVVSGLLAFGLAGVCGIAAEKLKKRP